MDKTVNNQGRTEQIIRLFWTTAMSDPPNFGDGDSILSLVYEAYSEVNNMDDMEIKRDFHRIYELMNGMPLSEMDRIIYPICKLCRDHEKSGFVEGVKVGIRLRTELEG